MLPKISIKLRFTILTVILLTFACLVLTFSSIKSAGVILSERSTAVISNSDFMVNNGIVELPNEINILPKEISELPKEIQNIQEKFAIERIKNMALVICIGTILSYLLANRALKPITNLSNEIKNIDENRLNSKITEPRTKDEVAILATSFNQMLEKLDVAFESQKLLTQNVAHELKTPLSAVMTNIEVVELDNNPSNKELLEVIEITKRNIDRLSKIITDVLSLNVNIDKIKYENIDFSSMINEIENELNSFILEKNITVVKKGNIVIRGNRALLYHAFYNLILNAIRYNKENGNVNITCENGMIKITDTGIGIPRQSLNKVFEPFYCVDNSRSRALGGSGLGLPLVKSILDKHGFKIKIESTIGIETKIIIST